MNIKNRTVKIWATCLLAVFSVQANAQENEKDLFNPVNFAVISQTIAPDARGGGLGDVGAATDPDVNSQYWNPAKYPFNISRAGVALNFTPWLRSLVNDMNLAYLAGYYRIGDYSAVSVPSAILIWVRFIRVQMKMPLLSTLMKCRSMWLTP